MKFPTSFFTVFVSMLCLICACQTQDHETPPLSDDDSTDDDLFADDDSAAGQYDILLSNPVTVVPSEGLPGEVELQQANNNLDIAWFEDRVYLAFRTAPFHFASPLVDLYVISSADQITWRYEGMFHMDTDLREPRLLAYGGKLFLYFALLGTNPLNFEPGGMMESEYIEPGQWTEPQKFYGDGFIPWRTKVVNGKPFMLTYEGGENLYDVDPEPTKVHWLTTEDGVNWEPVIPGQPVVLEGGVSETDFVFLDDGTLIAVSRNELGDENGFGSKICRAEVDDLGTWNCVYDPKKYDSPLMFIHNNQPYLIGRRNLSGDGLYDLGYKDLPYIVQHLLYELDYWIHPKRTSLWKVDPETLDVGFVMDFPSKGDTCFPGLIRTGDDSFLVYNYTSPVNGPDVIWVKGQLGPTHIVRSDLEFVPASK